MSNFTIQPSQYENIPAFVLAEVDGLSGSAPYGRLSDDDRHVAGLVCAALTKYMVDLQERAINGTLGGKESKALDDAYHVVESLASSQETRIQNVVVTEVFENIRTSERVLRVIISRLGPNARRLHDRWVKYGRANP